MFRLSQCIIPNLKIWIRVTGPGRGTEQCYTVWTPFSDVSLEMGGLMVMEGSYREARFGSQGMAEYARGDVDGHCSTDEASASAIAAAKEESRALTTEEQRLVAAAKRSALKFPDTQQQIANAHTALAAGIGANTLLPI